MTSCTLQSLRALWQSGLASHLWQGCIHQPSQASHIGRRGLGRVFASSVAPTVPEHVTMDISAVQRLKELVQETPGQFLRVSVDPGGCSGFQYVFKLDNNIHDDDLQFSQDGVSMAVDKVSMEFLKGSTIEFAEDLIASSFRVKDNPNSEQGCGCGSSFAAKMD
eukprot:jgi/Ulvmu1/5024/UM021_0041.1